MVNPSRSLSTQPVAIRITGVHGPFTLTLRSRDAVGTTWTSTTRRAFTGAGAIYRLAATKKPDAFYIWSSRVGNVFRATVTQHGRVVAATTFTRRLGVGLSLHTTLAEHGFVGDYEAPPGKGRKPALLVFGAPRVASVPGSSQRASRGAGTPRSRSPISTRRAFRSSSTGSPSSTSRAHCAGSRRSRRSTPDASSFSASPRGSEAAQLLGVHYPKLVHGVVAVVPSNLVNCAYPVCDGSAWTLRGRQLPYVGPNNDSLARIPDERIHGPVLFICAEIDEIWPSCPYAQGAMADMRLDHHPHGLIVAPKSGHGVGSLVPYEPNPASNDPDAARNERGREFVWPKLLAFLRRNS